MTTPLPASGAARADRNRPALDAQGLDDALRYAVILCGGAGTRIRARYPDLPKALIPVAGRPFLEWQIEWLARAGVRRVVLAAGDRADRLVAWRAEFLRRAAPDAPEIEIAVEPRPLGTGGALRFAADRVSGDPVLALNGDSMMPQLDFQALETAWREFSKAWKKIRWRLPTLGNREAPAAQPLETRGAALAAVPIPDAGRFGTVEFDAAGRVTAFREKAQRTAGWVNGGVYLVDAALLRALPSDAPFSLEDDLFPALAEAGALIAAPSLPPLLDIGTPDGLAETERALS